ncbi:MULTISPECIES: hypothetical protein [Vibrio]|uniref:hypothetical protein n=1 Tax=Vibrio TaxID=662 RepID=UPI00142D3C29|nr:hypothetical protein [Vibrio ouci]
MKRFFPSSVMLTPFLVKHYATDEHDDVLEEEQQTELVPESDQESIDSANR